MQCKFIKLFSQQVVNKNKKATIGTAEHIIQKSLGCIVGFILW